MILNKFPLFFSRLCSQNCLCVVSDGNASLQKYYKQAWISGNVISPKCKQLCFSLSWTCRISYQRRCICEECYNTTFFQKKSAAEAHIILPETYNDYVLSETTCRDWFRRFRNKDFDVKDYERSGTPKKFKNEYLEALLHEDSCQAQAELPE